MSTLGLLLALAASSSLQVESTDRVGRRIENEHFVADLSRRIIDGKQEDSGALRALTYKAFGVTLLRTPNRMHWAPNLQRAGASGYKGLGTWHPVQIFREDRQGDSYTHHREGYLADFPEVKLLAEYRFFAGLPYFLFWSRMSVEKPLSVTLVRNNEMTMDAFFTHVAWPTRAGETQIATFEERRPLLEKEPIAFDAPWVAFLNLEKGYGYGFVSLAARQTKTAKPVLAISDGAGNGKYWARRLIDNVETALAPGDLFEERTAFVLFRTSKDKPLDELHSWEREIRRKHGDAAAGAAPALFDFKSAFWMNLHTYLHAHARANAPIAEPLPEAAAANDREAWRAAIAGYRERYGKRSSLFDSELVRIGGQVAAAESNASLAGADIPADTRRLLEGAAPIYRKHRWPEHDAANRRFVSALEPLLARHGSAIARRLAASYETTWPERPIRVDVVHDVGPPGNAQTTVEPTHVTIAATDPRHAGLAGLELVFHEASHGWGHVLTKGVSDAAARLGVAPPRDLWHALLFFNAGAITTEALEQAGVSGYRQYLDVNGLFERAFARFRSPILKHWPAFLEGEISRDQAIELILKELWPASGE
jgi:hypothetical protein